MAKLTGVKTIDMVNGEITKVEYGGVEYVRHSKGLSEAMTGDLFLSEGSVYTTSGEFYEITIDKNRAYSVRYIDDVGDNDGYEPGCPKHTLFRKQSAPTLTDRVTSLEQRVDSLEGKAQETYRLVTDREPKVGDFVKFSEEFAEDDIDLTAGNYYEVTNVESDGDVVFYDDLDDERFKDPNKDGVEVYEKVNATQPETITHNGATYTLVDRKAQPGDVVEYETGFITEVTGYDREGVLRALNKIGTKTWAVYGHYQPVKVYAPVAPKVEPLKVGDYAKVIGQSHNDDIPIGTVVKISKKDNSDIPFKAEAISGEDWDWFRLDRLVRATDEEVAQAKAEAEKQAEIARWAAIGRKPNEYKEGDIVRVQKGNVWFNNEDEIYGEVMNSNHQTQIKARYTDGCVIPLWISNNSVELITPVEARFDVTDRA